MVSKREIYEETNKSFRNYWLFEHDSRWEDEYPSLKQGVHPQLLVITVTHSIWCNMGAACQFKIKVEMIGGLLIEKEGVYFDCRQADLRDFIEVDEDDDSILVFLVDHFTNILAKYVESDETWEEYWFDTWEKMPELPA